MHFTVRYPLFPQIKLKNSQNGSFVTFLAVRAKNLNRNNSFCSISQTSKPAPKSPLLSLLPWPAIAFLILVILVIFPSVFPILVLVLVLSLSLSLCSLLFIIPAMSSFTKPAPDKSCTEKAQGLSLHQFYLYPTTAKRGPDLASGMSNFCLWNLFQFLSKTCHKKECP